MAAIKSIIVKTSIVIFYSRVWVLSYVSLFGAGKKGEFEAGGNATPEREDRSPQRWRSGDGPGWGPDRDLEL